MLLPSAGKSASSFSRKPAIWPSTRSIEDSSPWFIRLNGWWRKGFSKHPWIRDQIRRGLVYGWYFLPAASDPVAWPESTVDLHDLHTVSLAVLQRLIADGKRVCRIRTPYREHLAQHFAVTYSHIGLPEPYETEP